MIKTTSELDRQVGISSVNSHSKADLCGTWCNNSEENKIFLEFFSNNEVQIWLMDREEDYRGRFSMDQDKIRVQFPALKNILTNEKSGPQLNENTLIWGDLGILIEDNDLNQNWFYKISEF